jgi:hypothetical protein
MTTPAYPKIVESLTPQLASTFPPDTGANIRESLTPELVAASKTWVGK